ncbi:hypothetical protein D3Z60_12010 [Lachnospiraceae bacterium]|nr:hypothetical protein [Lachnospiraceae bacterium]
MSAGSYRTRCLWEQNRFWIESLYFLWQPVSSGSVWKKRFCLPGICSSNLESVFLHLLPNFSTIDIVNYREKRYNYHIIQNKLKEAFTNE